MTTTVTDKFDTITYLADGTVRQQEAYQLLTNYRFIELLSGFSPLLAGTIPLNIDIESSDLDIICYYKSKDDFRTCLIQHFSTFTGFSLQELLINQEQAILASFTADGWPIEIFGQNIPVKQQMAYRHMIVEYQLLQQKGKLFRKHVVDLKNQGYKTEPAFAKALGLIGDPYSALLNLEM
ncbi:DUF4269 domain-containing protein [Mucilaginibacter kameinonensis]|uniref:DUF4269 domain-containing protein n=1 Tax=Mucilaginibacter kameinonensis TaxID=452286 RepID=UPI000EF75AA4|nr:DUF4269 domain-containing protein [Mucilaginibacter kameinonensis]